MTLDFNATEEFQFRRTLLRKNHSSRGTRSGNLEFLVSLLNQKQKLFATWHENMNNPFHHVDEDDYVRFIRALTPWILSPPAYPSQPTLPLTLPSLPPLNCGESRYSRVFTGQPLSQPRIIVDFIPFGYDVDKLELRLYEYYDLVTKQTTQHLTTCNYLTSYLPSTLTVPALSSYPSLTLPPSFPNTTLQLPLP